MAVFWILPIDDEVTFFTGDITVTCAGTVQAPHGAALRRRIYIYRDNDHLSSYLTATASDPTYGTFSVQVPGHAATEFCVICKGNAGENDVVYANCNLNGTGPTGLYIGPALNNISFIVGPGEVTSPWIDVLFPTPVVDAEGEVEIIAWGEVVIPVVIEAEGSTDIMAVGDVNFGFSEIYGEADVFYDTYANPQIPGWQISSESSNGIWSWGNIVLPTPKVKGIYGTIGDLSFPASIVYATVSNPIVCYGDVVLKPAVVSGTGEFGRVSWGACDFSVAILAGEAVVYDNATGDVIAPIPSAYGIAHTMILASGEVFFSAADIDAFSPLYHVFDPINYEPDCGLADPIAYGAVSFPELEIESA